MTKLADSAGPSLLLYILNREPHLFGVSARMYALTSTILLFILLPRRYIISLMLLDRKILCITPLFFHSTALHVFYSLSLFIYFFLYIFSLCRSLSTYIRVNETLYAKSRLTLHIIYSRSSIQKRRVVVWHISFPIFF